MSSFSVIYLLFGLADDIIAVCSCSESEVTATDELASGTSSPKRLQNIKMNGSSSSLDGSTSSIPNMPNGHLHGMSNGKVRQRARKQQQQ